MRLVFYALIVLVAAVTSFGFSTLIWKLSTRFRLYPQIRERDVHSTPTPRLGGVAMFLALAVAFSVASQLPDFSLVFSDSAAIYGLLGACLLIVLIGVADDIFDLDWYTKLAGQFIAAGILAGVGGLQLYVLPVPGATILTSPVLSLTVTVFLIVLVMNAVNFIDGLDGLVAGVAVIANGVFFFYSYRLSTGDTGTSYFNLGSLIAAVVIGVCLGFLPLNWRRDDSRPAKLFMGDAGALLIGLLMAASTIAVTSQLSIENVQSVEGSTNIPLGGSGLVGAFIPIVLPLAVLILPVLDFGLAVLRRTGAGKSPFSADRKHLHHRLLDMGHSHQAAVLIFYSWAAVASIGCLLFLFVDWWWALTVTFAGLMVCATITLAPLSRRKAVEAAVQSASPVTAAGAELARFDPLDAASAERGALSTPTRGEAAATIIRIAEDDDQPHARSEPLHEKKGSL